VAVIQGTHAGAIAKVGDDGTTAGGARIDLREHRRDVLVGEAMEAISDDAFIGERSGQGDLLGDERLGAMKGRIEAGDLW
jgi:hypothetical protein